MKLAKRGLTEIAVLLANESRIAGIAPVIHPALPGISPELKRANAGSNHVKANPYAVFFGCFGDLFYNFQHGAVWEFLCNLRPTRAQIRRASDRKIPLWLCRVSKHLIANDRLHHVVRVVRFVRARRAAQRPCQARVQQPVSV